MMKKSAFFLILILMTHFSDAAIDKIRLSVGQGAPDHVVGARLATQSNMLLPADFFGNWEGFWETSFASWKSRGDAQRRYRTLHAFAFAPLLRYTFITDTPVHPCFEASIGLVGLSARRFGHRDLGARLAFQDQFGIGFTWGQTESWEVLLHYLHYSNAGMAPPNQGVDIKPLLSVSYQF